VSTIFPSSSFHHSLRLALTSLALASGAPATASLLDVVELEPRPVKAAPVAPPVDGASGGEPPLATDDAAPSAGVADLAAGTLDELARMPWNVWVGTSTSYQTLFNADAVSNDYLVSYLDIVLTAELWEGTTMELEFEGTGGNGPDGQIPGYANVWSAWNANAGTYQSPDGFDRLLVAEGFISLGNVAPDWVLDVGKIAATNYIDTVRVANNSVNNFLSAAFTNAMTYNGPFRGGGLALSYVGSSRFDFRAVAVRPDNSGDNAASNLFGGAQTTLYWNQEEAPGALALYVWQNGGDDDRTGAGLNLDQDIGANVTAFGRLGWSDEVDVGAPDQAIETSWMAGCELRGDLWGSTADAFTFAVGTASAHDAALEDEFVFEGYYRHGVNDHCEVSLHWQGIDNLAGDAARDLVTSLGVRVNVWL